MNNLTQEEIIRKYKITAKKSLGQNFLCDAGITAQIAAALQAGEDELIFEIGPGLGALSQHLAGACKHFTAIELDSSLIGVWQELYGQAEGAEILSADAMKFDFDTYAESLGFSEYKIIGNLPYYITTPIIMRIIEECRRWRSLVFMMQKEVAERLCAPCGSSSCGAVTYSVFYRAETELLLSVPPTAFAPRPEVFSSVVRFEKKDKPPVKVKDEQYLFSLIKAGFAQRRKTLLNSFANCGIADKATLQAAFAACGIEPVRRGETLSLEEYNALAEKLAE